jgi:hypothetical protein
MSREALRGGGAGAAGMGGGGQLHRRH